MEFSYSTILGKITKKIDIAKFLYIHFYKKKLCNRLHAAPFSPTHKSQIPIGGGGAHVACKPKGRFFWYAFGIYKPKVTMFAEEMWFGVGDGVECGRSTGLCPLPLGVPRCVIHNKKNVGTKFLVILKKNKY